MACSPNMQTDRRVLCGDFSRKPSVQIAYLADKYHPTGTQLVYTFASPRGSSVAGWSRFVANPVACWRILANSVAGWSKFQIGGIVDRFAVK
jgi:hypothetical protein